MCWLWKSFDHQRPQPSGTKQARLWWWRTTANQFPSPLREIKCYWLCCTIVQSQICAGAHCATFKETKSQNQTAVTNDSREEKVNWGEQPFWAQSDSWTKEQIQRSDTDASCSSQPGQILSGKDNDTATRAPPQGPEYGLWFMVYSSFRMHIEKK